MIQIENYLPLVYKTAHRYKNRGIDFDELVGLGTDGLYHALKKFDYKQPSFGSYAEYWIRGYICENFRKKSRHYTLGESLLNEEELEDRLIQAKQSLTCDSIICPEQAAIITNRNDLLYKHLAKLSTREIKILRERYLTHEDDVKSYKDLAKDFGVSFQRIQQIENRALEKLRQSLCV